MKPRTPALGVQSLNLWTTREVPVVEFSKVSVIIRATAGQPNICPSLVPVGVPIPEAFLASPCLSLGDSKSTQESSSSSSFGMLRTPVGQERREPGKGRQLISVHYQIGCRSGWLELNPRRSTWPQNFPLKARAGWDIYIRTHKNQGLRGSSGVAIP